MGIRALFMPAVALATGACVASALAASSVAGAGDVRVLSVRFVPAGNAGPGLAAGGATYVLARVELTNDAARDFTPAIDRFFLTTPDNGRYQGIESGSSAFVGVSNSHRMLKAGAKRDYVVGFRTADPVVAGTVSYEP
jgi:hypothetical protein